MFGMVGLVNYCRNSYADIHLQPTKLTIRINWVAMRATLNSEDQIIPIAEALHVNY